MTLKTNMLGGYYREEVESNFHGELIDYLDSQQGLCLYSIQCLINLNNIIINATL